MAQIQRFFPPVCTSNRQPHETDKLLVKKLFLSKDSSRYAHRRCVSQIWQDRDSSCFSCCMSPFHSSHFIKHISTTGQNDVCWNSIPFRSNSQGAAYRKHSVMLNRNNPSYRLLLTPVHTHIIKTAGLDWRPLLKMDTHTHTHTHTESWLLILDLNPSYSSSKVATDVQKPFLKLDVVI